MSHGTVPATLTHTRARPNLLRHGLGFRSEDLDDGVVALESRTSDQIDAVGDGGEHCIEARPNGGGLAWERNDQAAFAHPSRLPGEDRRSFLRLQLT